MPNLASLPCGEGTQEGRLDFVGFACAACVRPIQAIVTAPALLFVATLAVMVFRPANIGMLPYDRLLFFLLTSAVLLRILLLRSELPVSVSFTLPMLALLLLALAGTWKQGYDAETWSLLGAQFLVPFVMFHVAMAVFTTDFSVRQLEFFCVLLLAYLCFISIAFILGQRQLIFPRFVLNQQVEMHVDRARGPFLQAVANGVSMNLLGLIALDCYRRRRFTRLLLFPLLLALPLAIFATMTRSVWLSFAMSLGAIGLSCKRRHIWTLLFIAGLGTGAMSYIASAHARSVAASQERFQDRSTVDFRFAVYRLGWEMFRDRPLFGWGQGEFAREIETRISAFRPGTYAAHNTFIAILVEHGAVGLLLYLSIAWNLVRLRKTAHWLKVTWPICLGVYFVNACCVVMNYQFVNALVFTLGGVVAASAQSHTAELHSDKSRFGALAP